MFKNVGVTVDTHRGGGFDSVDEVRECFEDCAKINAPAAFAGKPHGPRGQALTADDKKKKKGAATKKTIGKKAKAKGKAK